MIILITLQQLYIYYNIHTFKLGSVIYSNILKSLFCSERLHLFVQKKIHAWFKKGVPKMAKKYFY